MGERTQFNPGERAPNDGMYVEVSEARHAGSVKDTVVIHLQRGERFPETKNKDRKWTHKKN
ncbi:YjzC family protein [Sulfoacidibacillus thermotolerans]|uniref:YjzC family protein n=1 Tax=Sulfoacidibacillus thermotolerans TaxID=1765684 RepID=A0A2U3DAJ7_SULT2|nr:YjzC family protein [Sulfoacidibacillus thermotolerans]PWI58307.1 YjzC family protein [Sulfoacidibacillus thermotolerans]